MISTNSHVVSKTDLILWGEENIDDRFIKSIGRIVISFSHLEHVLTLFCGTNIGVSYPINEIITSELSFKQLVNLTISIYKEIETDEEKLQTVTNICKKALQLEEKRNIIIHSYYGKASGDSEKVVRKKITAKSKKGHTVQERRN